MYCIGVEEADSNLGGKLNDPWFLSEVFKI